jgi:hypothetical protein
MKMVIPPVSKDIQVHSSKKHIVGMDLEGTRTPQYTMRIQEKQTQEIIVQPTRSVWMLFIMNR